MITRKRGFYGKIILTGILRAETGLRIGAGRNVGEIGGVDSPVMRDPSTGYPYIPGSSLKGRMRSLFEVYIATKLNTPDEFFNKDIGGTKIHACENYEKAYNCPICRVFGSSGTENFPARIIVRDLQLTENWRRKPLEEITEIKQEISIDRITSKTNLRTVERVVRGAEFEFEIIYTIEDLLQWKDDLRSVLTAMHLVEDSYLGGSGSRGYGKVKFEISDIILKLPEYYKTGDSKYLLRVTKKEGERFRVEEILKKFDELLSDFIKVLEGGEIRNEVQSS
ncbi:type III-A CRISPR-associated RAMP protein Csm3 [Pyrococcus sp. ST04]|uniref:type III-A CRISPR-associated RAMP protein Csm3 n=1 Tax=Pyrococcus sp. ST04 TaxID=1183377 RepID=UPI000260591D|nr:type III-A CRISPR-associated RAMP protein Csm3 [Pyrococcus sp. ST04]AFK21710.1 putative CRISPR-associated RAMP protein, Csm3 family [Pyrococcus sp. ST04]